MEQNGSPQPFFETDDIHTHFLAVLPVHPEFLKEVPQESEYTDLPKLESPRALEILEFCKEAKSRKEIMKMLGISNHPKNLERYITPLIENKSLALTLPDKLQSRNQKYYTTIAGIAYLDQYK